MDGVAALAAGGLAEAVIAKSVSDDAIHGGRMLDCFAFGSQ